MARTKGSYRRDVVKQPEGRLQAWQSMRIMRRFTRDDLLTTADVGKSNLEKYLKALIHVDIVRVAVPRVSGRPGSRDVLQLIVNTGPKPPVPWKNGQVYDPNTDMVHYVPGEEEDEQLAGAPARGDAEDQHQEGGEQAGPVAGNDQPGA